MKRITVSIITILCLLLTSCQGTNHDVYEVLGNPHEYTRYENPAAEKEKNAIFLGESYALTYVESVALGELVKRDYYDDEENLLEFGYSSEDGKLLLISTKARDQALIPNEGGTIGTDAYFSWVEEKIAAVLEVDVDDYVLEWEPDYLGGNKEILEGYYIYYTKYIGGYRTHESVMVSTLPDGSLREFVHFEFPCHEAEGVVIDEKKLERTIKKCVGELSYRGKKYTVDDIMWGKCEGRICLLCTVKVKTSDAKTSVFTWPVVLE